MSEKNITLALTFLQTHPDLAATTLEQHPSSSVASFLSKIPHSYSVPVLRNMLPGYAARVCDSLTRERMLGIFNHLETGQIVAILRHVDKARQQDYLKDLPAKIQLVCSILLKYSREVVGAWVTPQIATISHDCSVGEALIQLKSSPDVVHTDFIYVVNRDSRLMGRTRLIQLLKAQRKIAVNSLIETCRITLSARIRIKQAALDENWKKLNEIPVINRNQEFIGVLRQLDLRKALGDLEPQDLSGSLPSSVIGLSAVYGESLLALYDSLQMIVKTDFRS